MLGIDTNVPVRFLLRDNEAQFQRARQLIKRETSRGQPIFISQLVLLPRLWETLRATAPKIRIEILPLSSSIRNKIARHLLEN